MAQALRVLARKCRYGRRACYFAVTMSLSDRARAAVASALESMAHRGELGEGGALRLAATGWGVGRPKRPEHGDLATNAALALAKQAGRPPLGPAGGLARALAG